MRIRLAWKIGLLTVLPVILVAAVSAMLVYRTAIDVLIKHEIVDLKDEAKVQADQIRMHIAGLREDVLKLAGAPPIQGIIRARKEGQATGDKRDLQTGKTERELRIELQDLMRSLCGQATDSPKPYLQVRFVGAEDSGREIVRIQRRMIDQQTEFKPVSLDDLDSHDDFQKGDRTYFTETRKLDAQEVFLSDVEVNIDKDASQKGVTVIRAAVPIRRSDDTFSGIVIINMDFDEALKDLMSSPRHLVYLTNDRGQFLFHPDHSKVQIPRGDAKLRAAFDPNDDCLIQNNEDFAHIKESFHAEDKHATTFSGKKVWALEYRGVPFPERFIPKNDRFSLARINIRAGTAPDELDKLEDKLDELRKQHPDFRCPRDLSDEMRSGIFPIPLSAKTIGQLQKITRQLDEGIVRVQYQIECKEFAAHFFRVYFDPRRPKRYLGFVMAFSYEEMDAELGDTQRHVFWSVLGLTSLVGASALVFSRFLTRRLTKITRASEKISQGDFEVSLPVTSRDEVGDLARGFQTMIGEVQARGEKIKEREARLRMVVDSAAEGILSAYDGGTIHNFNMAAERMFGYRVDELRDESVKRLIAASCHQQIESSLQTLCLSDSSAPSVALEVTGLRKDRAEFPLEVSISSVLLGTQRVFTFLLRDITQRKRHEQRIQQLNEHLQQMNEELEQRVRGRTAEWEEANSELAEANEELREARDKAQELTRAKNSFLASVSHELRNPLNQVSGFCQLLELTQLDDSQREDLKKIRLAANQLLVLVNDILDYQKIVMGGLGLVEEEFDVAELLDEVRDATEFLASEDKNRLSIHWDNDIGRMYTDKQRVRQVLINLVSNSSKFTHEGDITVVASRSLAAGIPWVEFSVADTGRGMKTEEQEQLFTPFVKFAAKEGNRKGTGLGLVISKGFCERMGGDISFVSQFGEGTTFTVRLPSKTSGELPEAPTAAQVQRQIEEAENRRSAVQKGGDQVSRFADAQEKAEYNVSGDKQTAAPQERTVLVVDDDAEVREMMQRYLSGRGFHVVTAADGFEALELVNRLQPAVITLDAIMPGLDGWAVLAALKTDAGTKDIPVVMVTIVDPEENRQRLGAAEFLAKPIDWHHLSTTLSKYVDGKREQSILIVDDDGTARDILRRSLEQDGWSVLEAEHGKEALTLLAVERPAAILLDLVMPVMDGFEFIAEYSQLAEWLSIPVLVLSAKDPTPEETEKLEGLVVRVLRKGDYSQEELLDEIHRRVDEHLQTPQETVKENT